SIQASKLRPIIKVVEDKINSTIIICSTQNWKTETLNLFSLSVGHRFLEKKMFCGLKFNLLFIWWLISYYPVPLKTVTRLAQPRQMIVNLVSRLIKKPFEFSLFVLSILAAQNGCFTGVKVQTTFSKPCIEPD